MFKQPTADFFVKTAEMENASDPARERIGQVWQVDSNG
jgi:hypothetical protein